MLNLSDDQLNKLASQFQSYEYGFEHNTHYSFDYKGFARALLAAASAQATAPVGWFVQRSSFGPWIEVERYEDGAVRLHRMDGDQATGPAVQFTPSQLATLYMALGHFKSSGSVKCADSIMSVIKMDRD